MTKRGKVERMDAQCPWHLSRFIPGSCMTAAISLVHFKVHSTWFQKEDQCNVHSTEIVTEKF